MQEEWQSEVVNPIQDTLVNSLGYLPNIFYALATFVAGVLLAFAIRAILIQLSQKIISGAQASSKLSSLGSHSLNSIPVLLGTLCFWVVILFSIAASLQALGLDIFPRLGNQFGAHIPNIFISLVVIFATYVIAKLVRELITRTSLLQNIKNSGAATGILQLAIWSIGLLIVADQLGIRSTALMIIFAVVSTAIFGAFALSFGLGAKTAAENLLSAHYAMQMFEVGDTIEISGYKGTITKMTGTAVVLASEQGSIYVPGSVFGREIAVVQNK